VSGRFAITPGFEAPPVQPAPTGASIQQTAAAQVSSTRDASQVNLSSVFANLIQELAQETAPPVPAVAASSKTATSGAQQSAVLPGQLAPKLPAAALTPAARSSELPATRLVPSAHVPELIAMQPGLPAPTPEQPAPQPDSPALAAIELPPMMPGDGRKAGTRSTSAPESAVGSVSDVPVKDGDKPVAPPPASPTAPSQGTRRQAKSDPPGPQENSAPITVDAALFMPAAPPVGLKLAPFIMHLSEGSGDVIPRGGGDLRAPSPSASSGAREQTHDLRLAPALELKIRAQDQPASEQSAAPGATPAAPSASRPAPTERQTDTELPSPVMSATQPHAEQLLHTFASTVAPAATEPNSTQSVPAQTTTTALPPTPVNPTPTINTNASYAPAPPPQAPTAHLAEEPVSRQPEQHAQPLRSLSLEFAPDGAQDVRVRLEEHAGDVHISLHSTDPALSGRLSDGVHELVATLSSAGYDAQGWTHGQDRQNHGEQNQAPPDDPRRNRRGDSADPGTEDFDALVQQPGRTKP